MIPLRLRRRRDGSLCLTDSHGRTTGDGREFPDPHGFTMDWLVANGSVVELSGDELKLELANARATYKITERRPTSFDVELVSSEVFDPIPIDEDKAATLAAGREDSSSGTVEGAAAGSALVNEEG